LTRETEETEETAEKQEKGLVNSDGEMIARSELITHFFFFRRFFGLFGLSSQSSCSSAVGQLEDMQRTLNAS